MNTTDTRIRLCGPADLLPTIPYLLGFHPTDSLVVVGLSGSDLVNTFRVDLPDSVDRIDELQDLTKQLQRNRCFNCLLVAYGEADLAAAALDLAAQRLRSGAVEPVDRIRITKGRWFSLQADDPRCPPEGLPVPESSAASCEFAMAGGFALRDRSAVSAQLDPVEPGRRAMVASAIHAALVAEGELDWPEQRARDLHTVDHWMSVEELPEADDIACLGLALGDTDVRDYVIDQIGPGERDGRLDLWIWVARHLEDDLVAPAVTIAGFAAYRAGNGVLALEAFERALCVQPNYQLALTLFEALQAGIPPSELHDLESGKAGGTLDG